MALFGWAVLGIIIVVAVVAPMIPWPGNVSVDGPPGSDFGVLPEFKRAYHRPRRWDSDAEFTSFDATENALAVPVITNTTPEGKTTP